jgi:spermidine/putrescine transport system substrate-binding protein
MTTRDPLDMMLSGRMDRRAFNQTLASLGLGLATVPLATQAATKEAHYYTWAGYELPEFHQSYIDEHGVPPDFGFFASVNEAMQKIRAGYHTDVSHPCSDNVTPWYEAGLLAPIDTSRLTHWKDYFSTFTEIGETLTPKGENLFVPFEWGNSSILYRTDLVDIEEESWSLLFDERYKGKLATYNAPYPGVQVPAMVLGYKNLETLSDEQLAEVRKLLEKQREVLRFYWDSQSEAAQAMAAGEIVATYAWNSLVKPMKDEGLPVKFMTPKEGARTWVCGLVLTAAEYRVGSDDKVYDFLNAMMSPEAGAFLINEYGYGHANSKAFDLVPEERIAEVGLPDPEKFLEIGNFLKPIPKEFDEKYVQLWEEVRLGM